MEKFTVGARGYYKAGHRLAQGRHTIRLVSGGNITPESPLQVYHLVLAEAEGGEKLVIDLKDDDNIYGMIQAGVLSKMEDVVLGDEYYFGKPVYITEWNTVYDFPTSGPWLFSRTTGLSSG